MTQPTWKDWTFKVSECIPDEIVVPLKRVEDLLTRIESEIEGEKKPETYTTNCTLVVDKEAVDFNKGANSALSIVRSYK